VSELGKSALVVAAKVEASVALDLLTRPDLLARIKKEHALLKGK